MLLFHPSPGTIGPATVEMAANTCLLPINDRGFHAVVGSCIAMNRLDQEHDACVNMDTTC